MDSVLSRPGKLLHDRRRGDALVEFVLLAPTLLLVLYGIFEVGRVVDAWLIVQNAAREGARAGSVAYPDSAVGSTAAAATSAYLTTSGLRDRGDLTGTPIVTPLVTSDAVQVSAEVDVKIYTPIIRSALPGSVPVRATVAMRRQ